MHCYSPIDVHVQRSGHVKLLLTHHVKSSMTQDQCVLHRYGSSGKFSEVVMPSFDALQDLRCGWLMEIVCLDNIKVWTGRLEEAWMSRTIHGNSTESASDHRLFPTECLAIWYGILLLGSCVHFVEYC